MTITLDKTWSVVQYPVDYVLYATAANRSKYMHYCSKQALVTAGWTVTHSSDSSSAGASDLWTDYTKVVSANAGSAHSWVVLTNSSYKSGFGACLDLTPSSSNLYNATWVFCPSGFNADGTTTNRPTAAGTSITWSNKVLLSIGTYGATVSCYYASDSSCFRLIHTIDGSCGDNSVIQDSGSAILIETPKYAASWWSSPFVVACLDGSGTYTGGLAYASVTDSSENNMTTLIGSNAVQLRLASAGVTTWLTRSPSTSYGNSYDSGIVMAPIYFASETASYPGIYGVMYDAYAAPLLHLPNTRYKTHGNNRGLVKIGCLAIGCPYGYICP